MLHHLAGFGKQFCLVVYIRKDALRAESVGKKSAPTNFKLNPAQLKAVKSINQSSARSYLLHGVTGSGKTEIYLALTKQALASGHSVIMLVPEIALATQITARFEQRIRRSGDY